MCWNIKVNFADPLQYRRGPPGGRGPPVENPWCKASSVTTLGLWHDTNWCFWSWSWLFYSVGPSWKLCSRYWTLPRVLSRLSFTVSVWGAGPVWLLTPASLPDSGSTQQLNAGASVALHRFKVSRASVCLSLNRRSDVPTQFWGFKSFSLAPELDVNDPNLTSLKTLWWKLTNQSRRVLKRQELKPSVWDGGWREEQQRWTVWGTWCLLISLH